MRSAVVNVIVGGIRDIETCFANVIAFRNQTFRKRDGGRIVSGIYPKCDHDGSRDGRSNAAHEIIPRSGFWLLE